LWEPVKTYSSGMRARLAFAISMAVEFDCYLIDEIIAVGDARFHERCNIELFEKRKDRAYVIVSHVIDNIKDYCQRAGVLHQGRLHMFEDVASAYAFYQEATA
jgi:capsular polysaccharide transport system ATP-binding protein